MVYGSCLNNQRGCSGNIRLNLTPLRFQSLAALSLTTGITGKILSKILSPSETDLAKPLKAFNGISIV